MPTLNFGVDRKYSRRESRERAGRVVLKVVGIGKIMKASQEQVTLEAST